MLEVLLTALLQNPILAIEWADIRNFLLGMGTGFVLLSLAIAMLLISGENSQKRKKNLIRKKADPLNQSTIQKMIEDKQKELTDVVRVSDNAYFRVAFDLSYDLMIEIAQSHFPNSKYPLYELSAQEVLDLAGYITKRIDKMLSGKFIARFKNYRISTIVDIINKKKALDNSKLMKLNREYKISKLFSAASTVLNYANPIYWFRKLALKPSTTMVIKELCKLIIKIVGEETEKLYSRKMFETPEDQVKIEQELDSIEAEALTDVVEDPKAKTK
jgi:hypothetical protein